MKLLLILALAITLLCGGCSFQSDDTSPAASPERRLPADTTPVLLVLNIQDHFTRKVLPDTTATRVLDQVNALIVQTPPHRVIYIRSVLTTLDISFKGIRVDTLPGLTFDERLIRVNRSEVVKDKSNAFAFPELHEQLDQLGGKTVTVAGVMAGHCVYNTLLGGKKAGYAMRVAPAAVGGKHAKETKRAFRKLKRKGIGFMQNKIPR